MFYNQDYSSNFSQMIHCILFLLLLYHRNLDYNPIIKLPKGLFKNLEYLSEM